GRQHPEGRRRDDAEPQVGLQERGQRGRGDRGRDPHPEVLQGREDGRGHRQRLFLRSRLLGVLPGRAQALHPGREVRARALPQARRDGLHLAHRRHPAVEGRSVDVLLLVRRRDDHHEAGRRGRPLQDHEGRLHHGGRRPRLAQEGVHAGRAPARLQHHVLRRPQGQSPAQAVRPRVQGEVQRVPTLRVRSRFLQRRVLQDRGREGRRTRQAMAREGAGREGAPGTGEAADRSRMTQHVVNVLLSGIFHASILFLVAAGLQVVFGVQKIFNLACGSFYALGAYAGVSAVGWYAGAGGPPALFILPLALAGLAVGAVGIVVERGLLSFVYDRDETFQLLLTFAVVLMMEDAIRMIWGTSPRSTSGLYLTYGQVRILGAVVPVYNLIVIAASLAIALSIGWLLTRTTFGRIMRAAADNREMAEALGVDMRRVYAKVFTLGTALGTLGGALVIPATAAMSEMGVELIVEAFAVVVIGGLGSMRGALVGARVVGVLRV